VEVYAKALPDQSGRDKNYGIVDSAQRPLDHRATPGLVFSPLSLVELRARRGGGGLGQRLLEDREDFLRDGSIVGRGEGAELALELAGQTTDLNISTHKRDDIKPSGMRRTVSFSDGLISTNGRRLFILAKRR
jgi:hypothetical protein